MQEIDLKTKQREQINFEPLKRLSFFIRENKIQKAYLDLDKTLADTSQFYTETEVKFFESLGLRDPEFIERLHMDLIHLSGKEIIEQEYAESLRHGKIEIQDGVSDTNVYELYKDFCKKILSTTGVIDIPLIPGADRIIATLRSEQIPYLIVTNSQEDFAQFIIRNSLLREILDPTLIKSQSTVGHVKSTPEFWESVIGESRCEKSIGFEDAAEAAQWMISLGEIDHVFLLQACTDAHRQHEISLIQSHGDRVTLLNSLNDLA